MSYYADSALTTKDFPVHETFSGVIKFEAGRRGMDLLLFPECDEYLASSVTTTTLWHSMHVQGLPSRFLNKKDYTRDNLLYKERFEGVCSNQSLYFFFLMMLLMAFYSTFFFPPYAFITSGGGIDYSIEVYKNFPELLYILAITFICSKFFQYKLWHDKGEEGYFFNRQNGMVERRTPNQRIMVPFKEFRPLAVRFRGHNGKTQTGMMLFHEQMKLAIPFSSYTLASSIIAWSYIKQFMDTSRPLPDIPEHEATRHLDPTTKIHDEQTGRDPFFWRKKTNADFKKMENEARERVKATLKEDVYYY